jgi:hypothetical protein
MQRAKLTSYGQPVLNARRMQYHTLPQQTTKPSLPLSWQHTETVLQALHAGLLVNRKVKSQASTQADDSQLLPPLNMAHCDYGSTLPCRSTQWQHPQHTCRQTTQAASKKQVRPHETVTCAYASSVTSCTVLHVHLKMPC